MVKGKKRRPKKGKGKIGDLFRKAKDFVKSNKLVSKGLNALSGALPAQYSGIAKGAAETAAAYGYGRRNKMGRGRLVKT